ncbi:hypothetical protein OHA72_43620 [Dactylosporangium sp. NBC_01737]|uniref:hypothetical protein n=1 Tax=Dactylosporangium sp. NBC_01737 TaxID=2975959 RepID=UPI002E11DDA9|nr:hypothetical protein OHA72_43620 [Dactylosporangium sp. NBC_01737]
MGGRSYMLATRMPMSRAGFDAWLATPLPGLDVIDNPAAMWTGWTDADAPDWDLAAIADHPAAVAAIRDARTATPLRLLAARAAGGVTLARHHDGALEIYLYDYHADAYSTQTDLLMLAGAGRFAEEAAPVMYWGGNVYPDLPFGGDGPLAVLLVDRAGARFVDRYPLDALIGRLRPVEAVFVAAGEAAGGEGDWDAGTLLDPAVRNHMADG